MSLSLDLLLRLTSGKIANPESFELGAPTTFGVRGIADLREATSEDVAFFFSRAYEADFPASRPGVLITAEPFLEPIKRSGHPAWKNATIVVSQDPYLALGKLSEFFATQEEVSLAAPSIHPLSVVDATAVLGRGVRIAAHCVVGPRSVLGDSVSLEAGVVVGADCTIGAHSALFPRVVLYDHCLIGARVRIHAGAVVGSDGFGYVQLKQDKKVIGHQKIYHLGGVQIGDEVEIGANCTIDRGTFGKTIIGKSAKLDNLVHVGHNSKIDEGAIVCGGTCLAGNASLGKFSFVGGLSGVTNHVHVGDGANVGAMTLVTKDVPPLGTAVGSPQRSYRDHFKAHALLGRLVESKTQKKE